MIIDDIRTLIASGESRTLELKKTTGELKDGMHTACAFLNSDGGWLIFGVTPKSLKIVGQEVTDNTQREIAQALSGIEPMVNVNVEYIDVPEHSGNKVIAMHFDGWKQGEQSYTYHGCPYYKVESTTRVMPREMYDERIRAYRPQRYAWEQQVTDNICVADLNAERIRGSVRLGVEGGRMPASAITDSVESLLSKLQLITGDKPNNAAAMMFSTKTSGYPQFRLRMARFRGTNKNVFIDNQQAEGNFFDLLDAGMAFLFKHLSLSGEIVGLMRKEHLEVPVAALREALINALCHRQYERYNLTIGIAIYDDRIEISNPGILPPQITPETIKLPHDSYPYNPLIAQVLYKTTFLENWGSGAQRIIETCRSQGLEEPIWTSDGGFITVTFKRPSHQITSQEKKTAKEASEDNNSLNTPQAPPKHPSSTPQVELLKQKMGNAYMTMKEIAELCGIKDLKYFRKSYIIPALEIGVIERLYPNHPKHPKQQYRLRIDK